VALECLGYTLLWQGSFWTRVPAVWKVAATIALLVMASAISWTAARALGRQLRVDAAIDATHELVRSGPYRFVRHPIYTSMLCVIVGTGLMIAPAYLFLPGLALFLVGTEIRMRTEDRLLESRFGEQFQN
jgi:protein-S-isoprenylcysteine O-methyltransferase Ste14